MTTVETIDLINAGTTTGSMTTMQTTTDSMTTMETTTDSMTTGETTTDSMTTTDSSPSIEDIIKDAVEAITQALENFQNNPFAIVDIFNNIKEILENNGLDLPDLDLFPSLELPSLSDWPLLCKLVWWPYDDEHCRSMRCSACSTAMIAASKVCEKTGQAVDQRCFRSVLGDGACNYCVADYLP